MDKLIRTYISPDSIELDHGWEHWEAKVNEKVVCAVDVSTISDL